MRIRWRGLELAQPRGERSHDADRHLRQVHRRAVRARLRRDRGQQSAPHPALQPGRQRRHPGQDPGRAARDQHHPRRRRGRHRHHPEHQEPGGQERQRPAARPSASSGTRSGVVKAKDIITDPDVEIINPDHVIATLTDDVPFVVEMTRRERPRLPHGRGERRARSARSASSRSIRASRRSSASSTRSRTPASVSGPTTTSWSWKSGPTAR